MSTTNETDTNESTDEAVAAAASTAASTESKSDNDNSAPDEGLSGVEAAVARAGHRVDSENSDEDNSTASDDKAGDENNKSGEPGGEKAAGETDENSDGTVEIPVDWPQERREAVESLPVEAQQIVLSVSQDMQAGLTSGLQTIADIREQHQGIIDSMDEHGFSGERVSEVLGLAAAFDADPKGTIEALALDSGIELFFSQEESNGQPPEGVANDPVKYSKWVTDNARKEIAKEQAHKEKIKAAGAAKKASEARLHDEFKQAEESIPEFAEHKPAVIAKLQDLSEGASVQDAFKLTTYDSLIKMAEDGQKAQTELAALKTEMETLKKNGTQLVKGKNLLDEADPKLKDMNPIERGLHKAQLKMNAQ